MTDKTYRTRNLGIAAGLALLAALLTMLYVSRAEGKTKVGNPSAGAYVPVLVATKDLAIGTPFAAALANGSVTVKRLPADSIAANAVRTPTALQGRVVVQPIYANEQLTPRRFGTPTQQGIRAVLRGDLRAMTVAGDPRQLLAGTLSAGDHVDVVVNDRTDGQQPRTRVALRDLIVLSAPGGEGMLGTQSDGSTAVTLQLTDKQVQVLWWAVKNGDWSLVLRPGAKAKVTATAPTGRGDVMRGS